MIPIRKKIARQIHLPLQSGSTKILKEMNRKHTKEDYLKIVEKLKSADKNISISCGFKFALSASKFKR